ncbi:MAG: hypothetical protein WBC73_00350 [Phormidesmis sp.]
MGTKLSPLFAETRILLGLWALNTSEYISKSKFKTSSSKAYEEAIAQLERDGALASQQKAKNRKVYALTDEGKQRLAKNLANEEFSFSTNIGPKVANALLRWVRQQKIVEKPELNGNGKVTELKPVNSSEAFEEVVLKTYEQLNRDYNLDDLVPIYRLRRELGDTVTRSDFNEWLLDVQAKDLIQLTSGEMPDITQDQREDSLSIPGGGMRFYVRRL